MSTKITDLIAHLPADLQPSATKWASLLVQCSFDELNSMVNLLLKQNYVEAYEFVFRHMTPEQRLDAMTETNAKMKAAKKKALSMDATFKAIGKEFLDICFALLLGWLKSEAGLP